MIQVIKKLVQAGRKGKCIVLPQIYLDSFEHRGLEITHMEMFIHEDDSILLKPIIDNKKTKSK